MKPQGHIPVSQSPAAHEGADLNVPLIARIASVLAAILLVLILAVTVLFHFFDQTYANRTSEAAPRVTAESLPPAPRLQVNPTIDLQAVRDQEDVHLEHYAWVDKAQGVAQVPIERAMALWVKTYTPPLVPTAPLSSTTNAPATTGTTELQMRQQKAQEAGRAP